MTGRLVLGAAGLAAGLYGVLRLLDLGWHNLVETAVWFAGGVLAHDAVLAPVVLVIGVALAHVLPTRSRRSVLVALVIVGTLTVTAIPVLGRFGARPDNPTLLDRPYWAGWLAIVGVAALALAARLWWDARNREGRAGGEGARGR